jgi:hypothetical protein
VNQFDNIVLRACFTDAWTTRYSPGDGGARYRPEDSLYLRDIWVKDSLADMGHLSGRNTFAHVYLNGLYWGLYNPAERLDASFFAEHLGGNKLDWDVIRDFSEVLAGSKTEWDQMMDRVNAGISSEADFQAVAELVDVENLTDYMLLHIFAEAEDWPHHNWYAARRRATNGLPATRWIFLAWDQEIVLDREVRRNRVNVSNNDTPARIYSELRAHPEFRRLFGDRVHRHLFNDGALTPARNADRLRARAEQVHQAMVGESARWGDAREFPISPNTGTGETFTRDEWWVPELQRLYTNFFPQLTADNLARFRSAGLYPDVAAPEFNQFGGAVPAGFELILTHTNSGGTIHFTRDGSDPRVYGSGAITASAEAYESPVPLGERTLVRARVLANGEWSALVEAVFHPAQDFTGLRFTELHYHPPDDGFVNGTELEFLELYNAGDAALDLSGLQFTDGIEFTFPDDVVLSPGDFIVLVANPDAFILRHPGITPLGAYNGQLSNSGETVTLSDPLRGPVLSMAYEDSPPWPPEADGNGPSLQLATLEGNPGDPLNWIAAPPTPGTFPQMDTDTDGDGMPDDWEIAHGTDAQVPDAHEDADGDGLTNLEEFQAGTHPNDPDSVLRWTRVAGESGFVVLEFLAVSNRTYSVLHQILPGSEQGWDKLVDIEQAATNRTVTLMDDISPDEDRLYRLVTPAQP